MISAIPISIWVMPLIQNQLIPASILSHISIVVNYVVPCLYFCFELLIVTNLILSLTLAIKDRIDFNSDFLQPAVILTLLLTFSCFLSIGIQVHSISTDPMRSFSTCLLSQAVAILQLLHGFGLVILCVVEEGEDANVLNAGLIVVYLADKYWPMTYKAAEMKGMLAKTSVEIGAVDSHIASRILTYFNQKVFEIMGRVT